MQRLESCRLSQRVGALRVKSDELSGSVVVAMLAVRMMQTAAYGGLRRRHTQRQRP
jgi:hypothetical protein